MMRCCLTARRASAAQDPARGTGLPVPLPGISEGKRLEDIRMRDPLPRVQRGLAAALRDRRTQLSAAAFVLTALAC